MNFRKVVKLMFNKYENVYDDDVSVLYSFFLCPGFVPLSFIGKVFSEAVLTNFKQSTS